MRERLLQFAPGTVQICFHRAQRQIHDLRDLLVRVSLDVAQENGGPVFRTELADRMLDLISEFPVLHILLRILDRRFYDEPCLLFFLRCSGVRRAVDRNGVELASSQMIDLVIVGNLENLATELVVRFVRGDGVERTDESLLC